MHTHSFQYYLPVNLIFGPGKTELLGEEAVRYGKKVLIVTGRHSTKRSGLLDRAKSLLEKAGAEVTVFDEVEPNPLASTVMKGAGIVKETGIHVIVGPLPLPPAMKDRYLIIYTGRKPERARSL